jgi:hypothetical protein
MVLLALTVALLPILVVLDKLLAPNAGPALFPIAVLLLPVTLK